MFEMLLLIGGPLLVSVAVGFAMNRFAIGRMAGGANKEIALAVSRAVFYVPALVHIGHGLFLPAPLLLIVIYSFREFGPDLDVLVFLIPAIVFCWSLASAWLNTGASPQPDRAEPPKFR